MTDGYWSPHTSSIEFCEQNYLHHNAIVELHNVWSSLAGISLFGFVGMTYGNATTEIRYFLAYLTLFLIGVGSAGLHGTMHWVFQSSDELPMIYLVVLMNFMIAEHGSPMGKPKYPRLPAYLSSLMVVNTLIYYTFQQFYFVFLATYITLLCHEVYMVYTLVFKKGIGGKVTRNLNFCSLFVYLAASVFWMIDMFYCDKFSFSHGMTFHIIWHFGAGFGAYLGIVSMENCRCVALGKPCELRYIFGIIPYMKLIATSKLE